MSYEITFGGRFQAGLNITTGKVVVKAGNLYLPATTANVALYPIAGLVVRYQQVPSANYDVGDIAHAGVWPSTLTGLSPATAGVATYARVTSTGSLESTTTPAIGDWLMGRINTDGDLILVPANEFGTSGDGGAQTVVNIQAYGAVCDGVADDSDAFDAALADINTLGIDVIQVPKTSGGCLITRTIRVAADVTSPIWHLTIEGTAEGPNIPPGRTVLYWGKAKRTGAAASLTATADDLGSVVAAYGLAFNYMLLSGMTGANLTSADVGSTKVRISGAANSKHNCIATIVEVVSSTSCRVAILDSSATTDANNAAITWTILEPIFELAARGCTIRNLDVVAKAGTFAYAGVLYTHPWNSGNSTTQNEVTGMRFRCESTGDIEWALEIGGWIVPQNAAFIATLPTLLTSSDSVNTYTRPFSPYQCDYLYTRDIAIEGNGISSAGGWMICPNASSQSRGHQWEIAQFTYKDYGLREYPDYPNAGAALMAATCGYDLHVLSAGVCSVALIARTYDQAPAIIRGITAEGVACIYKGAGQTAGPVDTLIDGGYIALTDTGAAAVSANGLFQIQSGVSLNVYNLKLTHSGLDYAGVFLTASNSTRGSANFVGCDLPHFETLQKTSLRDIFALQSETFVVNLRGCKLYRNGTGPVLLGDTTIAGGGVTSTVSTYDAVGASMLVRGLSNSLYQAENFFGFVTISGTETRKVWEFARPEEDEDYASHDFVVMPVLVATSGAASAGSAIATVPTGNKTRRSVCVEVEAAPGGGTSRTFGLMLVRHNVAASTAFHPMEIPGLVWHFDAEYDWLHKVTENPSLADNADRFYWRNQGPIREADGTRPAMDLHPHSFDEQYRPSTRQVDAGYNNKHVIVCDTNDFMRSAATIANPTLGTPLTMFIVGEPGGGAGNKTPFGIYGGAGPDLIYVYANGTTNVRAFASAAEISVAHNWNGKRVVCGVFDAGTSALYISAITAAVTGATGATAAGTAFTTAFDHPYGPGYYPWGGNSTGKIAAILVYNTALTTAQRTSVTNYLGTRFGETIGP